MAVNPYKAFKEKLILRDLLALDRTVLANERTLLAYLRTSLSLVIVGLGFVEFLESHLILVVGWSMIVLAVVIFIIGIWRYIRFRKMIDNVRENLPDEIIPEGYKEEYRK